MTIIRAIHQIWIGPKPAPLSLMRSWRDMNPSYEYILWDSDRVRSANFYNARQIAAQREWCGKADIIRYEVLHRYGGIYVDADSICVRPLSDDFLVHDSFAGYENEIARPGLIATGTVGASKGNELMRMLVDEISRLDMRYGSAWRTVGPQLMTRMVIQSGYTGLHVYPSFYFLPEHYTGLTYSGPGPVFARQKWGSTNNSYGTAGML